MFYLPSSYPRHRLFYSLINKAIKLLTAKLRLSRAIMVWSLKRASRIEPRCKMVFSVFSVFLVARLSLLCLEFPLFMHFRKPWLRNPRSIPPRLFSIDLATPLRAKPAPHEVGSQQLRFGIATMADRRSYRRVLINNTSRLKRRKRSSPISCVWLRTDSHCLSSSQETLPQSLSVSDRLSSRYQRLLVASAALGRTSPKPSINVILSSRLSGLRHSIGRGTTATYMIKWLTGLR